METLQVERADGVVTITFDRPQKKNAVNAQMWIELAEVARSLGASTEDRCVVLTGAGGDFCSGADLSDGPREPEHQLSAMRRINAVVQAFHDLPQPTIAKVDGVAAGVGMNFALGCDLVVASDRARFSEIFARRGLSLDGGGSWILPRLVGPAPGQGAGALRRHHPGGRGAAARHRQPRGAGRRARQGRRGVGRPPGRRARRSRWP